MTISRSRKRKPRTLHTPTPGEREAALLSAVVRVVHALEGIEPAIDRLAQAGEHIATAIDRGSGQIAWALLHRIADDGRVIERPMHPSATEVR